jgi:microcystin-dependent protein
MDEFLAMIKLFAGGYEPIGWMYCDGRALSIRNYTALYAVIGTNFGGDGVNTFCLPDLRGRVAVGAGSGNGLTPVNTGEKGGTEANVLTQHHVNINTLTKNFDIKETGRDGVPSVVTSVTASEEWAPINNRQPYLGINYIICVEGVFPSRS